MRYQEIASPPQRAVLVHCPAGHHQRHPADLPADVAVCARCGEPARPCVPGIRSGYKIRFADAAVDLQAALLVGRSGPLDPGGADAGYERLQEITSNIINARPDSRDPDVIGPIADQLIATIVAHQERHGVTSGGNDPWFGEIARAAGSGTLGPNLPEHQLGLHVNAGFGDPEVIRTMRNAGISWHDAKGGNLDALLEAAAAGIDPLSRATFNAAGFADDDTIRAYLDAGFDAEALHVVRYLTDGSNHWGWKDDPTAAVALYLTIRDGMSDGDLAAAAADSAPLSGVHLYNSKGCDEALIEVARRHGIRLRSALELLSAAGANGADVANAARARPGAEPGQILTAAIAVAAERQSRPAPQPPPVDDPDATPIDWRCREMTRGSRLENLPVSVDGEWVSDIDAHQQLADPATPPARRIALACAAARVREPGRTLPEHAACCSRALCMQLIAQFKATGPIADLVEPLAALAADVVTDVAYYQPDHHAHGENYGVAVAIRGELLAALDGAEGKWAERIRGTVGSAPLPTF